jgi:hypothetical protein
VGCAIFCADVEGRKFRFSLRLPPSSTCICHHPSGNYHPPTSPCDRWRILEKGKAGGIARAVFFFHTLCCACVRERHTNSLVAEKEPSSPSPKKGNPARPAHQSPSSVVPAPLFRRAAIPLHSLLLSISLHFSLFLSLSFSPSL